MKVGDIALGVLKAQQRPVHYTELTALMLEGGWSTSAKRPDMIVYACLHDFIKRRRDNPPVKLVGQGMFVAIEYEQVKAILPARKDASERKASSSHSSIPLEKRQCGNCMFIEFSGPQELRQTLGTCGKWEESQRVVTRCISPPCQCWRERTSRQRKADKSRRRELEAYLDKVNKKGIIAPRSLPNK